MSDETLAKMYTSLHHVDPEDCHPKTNPRKTWSHKHDPLLALVGFSIGLVNLWRFPYLCVKNGGCAFFLPYFFFVIICGIPLIFLEVSLGQFMSKAGPKAWLISPILQGLGWTTSCVMFCVSTYRSVIIAWAFYYLVGCFTSEVLPWSTCQNPWNTDLCLVIDRQVVVNTTQNYSELTMNYRNNTTLLYAATEHWQYQVLHLSHSIEDIGFIKWDLSLYLLLSWAIIFICTCKGMKICGNMLYLTVPTAYLFMITLLVLSTTLPGALDGILCYLTPNFTRLSDMQVWVDAGSQVFFSYAVGLGGLTVLGSYNKFNHNIYRDCLIFSLVNTITTFLAGLFVFCMLGFLAQKLGVEVEDVVTSGLDLLFVSIPAALTLLHWTQLWSAMFFIMVICFTLNNQFFGNEGIITPLADTFFIIKRHKMITTSVLCSNQFAISLSMMTSGGLYIFQVFDFYPASRIITLLALLECTAVAYIYGVNRFYDNIEMMMSYKISPWMKICWSVPTPALCIFLFCMTLLNYNFSAVNFNFNPSDQPHWISAIGWAMCIFCLLPIPFTTCYRMVQCLGRRSQTGNRSPDCDIMHPQGLQRHQLRLCDLSERDLSIELRTMTPEPTLAYPQMVVDDHEQDEQEDEEDDHDDSGDQVGNGMHFERNVFVYSTYRDL